SVPRRQSYVALHAPQSRLCAGGRRETSAPDQFRHVRGRMYERAKFSAADPPSDVDKIISSVHVPYVSRVRECEVTIGVSERFTEKGLPAWIATNHSIERHDGGCRNGGRATQ